MAVGGAVGGLLCSIVAPLLFNRALEYPLALMAAAMMIAVYVYARPAGAHPAGKIAYFLPLILLVVFQSSGEKLPLETVWEGRSFYGTLSVRDETSVGSNRAVHRIRHFHHGNTVHGRELVSAAKTPPDPLAYYSVFSGIGLYLQACGREEADALKVGLIGLGVGSLASYGRIGDAYTFYEIDPLVARMAADPKLFTFLSESPARVETVVGDARIQLARELEQGSRQYDVLVADAFSSDAIPMHLLTREAFQLYRAHLAEDGVIAVHISNRYFDFVPLMKAMADSLGLALTVYHSETAGLCMASDWAFLSKAPVTFPASPHGHVVDTSAIAPGALWTDDFHSLVGMLKTSTR